MNSDRYIRQEILASVGEHGQKKLALSRVLVVGAGGLGCPALLYLAGAGIGVIGIADGDHVEVTNLHRQVLFVEESIGRNKAFEAARILEKRNSSISYEWSDRFISSVDFKFVLQDWDVVIDATDRIETRYLLDDVCRIQNIPLIHASVSRDEIQVAVFDSVTNNPANRICYRDLYPYAPTMQQIRTCTDDGILGPVPGIAGTIQARECLGLLLGGHSELKGRLLWMDTVRYQQRLINIPASRLQIVDWPQSFEEIFQTDYTSWCSLNSNLAKDPEDWNDALTSGGVLVDVRELHEQPRFIELKCLTIPLNKMEFSFQDLDAHETIVVFCQSGSRGEIARNQLLDRWPGKRIFNVPGGVHSLAEQFLSINNSSS